MTNSTGSLSRATTDSSVRSARHAFTSPIVAAVSSFFLRCCTPIRQSLIASGKRQNVSFIKLPSIVGICSALLCSALRLAENAYAPAPDAAGYVPEVASAPAAPLALLRALARAAGTGRAGVQHGVPK